MSRARFGLYVFCRQSLFADCYELQPSLVHLLKRPTTLQLIPSEKYPTDRKVSAIKSFFQYFFHIFLW